MGDRYEAWKSEPVCNPLWIFVEMQLRYWNLLDPNCIGSNRIINTDSFPYQTSMKKGFAHLCACRYLCRLRGRRSIFCERFILLKL
jgi:hypothetical protein